VAEDRETLCALEYVPDGCENDGVAAADVVVGLDEATLMFISTSLLALCPRHLTCNT